MAINLKSTNALAVNGVKVLVYGQAGVGKTTLIKTLPNPVILSAEGGLLSLTDTNLPYIEINSIDTLGEAYTWLTQSEEAKQFSSVALDSISEIAEVVLSSEKQKNKDTRQAYGAMQDTMSSLVRAFRDLPGKHVYFSAKVEQKHNEFDQQMFMPAMPGQKLGQGLPYFFDEVLPLRVIQDDSGKMQRVLQCSPDLQWTAKDRSGKLSPWELPDLSAVINKILGEKETEHD